MMQMDIDLNKSWIPNTAFFEFCFYICVKVNIAWTHMKSWSFAVSSFVVWETKKPKLNI